MNEKQFAQNEKDFGLSDGLCILFSWTGIKKGRTVQNEYCFKIVSA